MTRIADRLQKLERGCQGSGFRVVVLDDDKLALVRQAQETCPPWDKATAAAVAELKKQGAELADLRRSPPTAIVLSPKDAEL